MSNKKLRVVAPPAAPSPVETAWGPWEDLDPAEAQAALGVEVLRVTRCQRCLVIMRQIPSELFRTGANEATHLLHLAIVGDPSAPPLTWDDLLRVQRELVGDEYEGVELYPAQDRIMDLPERHLWVLPKGLRFPVGFAPQHMRVQPEGEGGERACADDSQVAAPAPTEDPVADAVAEQAAADELARMRAQLRGSFKP